MSLLLLIPAANYIRAFPVFDRLRASGGWKAPFFAFSPAPEPSFGRVEGVATPAQGRTGAREPSVAPEPGLNREIPLSGPPTGTQRLLFSAPLGGIRRRCSTIPQSTLKFLD